MNSSSSHTHPYRNERILSTNKNTLEHGRDSIHKKVDDNQLPSDRSTVKGQEEAKSLNRSKFSQLKRPREIMTSVPLQALKTVVAEIESLRRQLTESMEENKRHKSIIESLEERERSYQLRLELVRKASVVLNEEVTALAESNTSLEEQLESQSLHHERTIAQLQSEMQAEIDDLNCKLKESEDIREALAQDLTQAIHANADLEEILRVVRPNPLMYRTHTQFEKEPHRETHLRLSQSQLEEMLHSPSVYSSDVVNRSQTEKSYEDEANTQSSIPEI